MAPSHLEVVGSLEKDCGYSESIEERCFSAALLCLEGHHARSPVMGPKTHAKVHSMISKTLEKTHNFKEVREKLSRNVGIWLWLCKVFAAAIPSLSNRTLGHPDVSHDASNPRSSTQLIVKNYTELKEDLSVMSKLLHIARNLLVTPEPEVPQDVCAGVGFDRLVYTMIKLCVSVTSKGYDGESLDDKNRAKLNEITDAYKKVLVTALQHGHNWTAKNDRNKMAFWLDVLFDEDLCDDQPDYPNMEFRPATAKIEICNWLERNALLNEKAQILLQDYTRNHAIRAPGPLLAIRPMCVNWLPRENLGIRADDPKGVLPVRPEWDPEEQDKFKQDAKYGRVSREIDTWWLNARDPNYEQWLVPMPSIEFAKQRTENCKANQVRRYSNNPYPEDHDTQSIGQEEEEELQDDEHEHDQGHAEEEEDYADPIIDEEEIEDDDSYGEGPMTGLLTEVPNILDPKQIEALHMIVKSCILDTPNGERTQVGENLQKTRCRMFLATDCGKSLLREMLVFIAVWEKDESSLIFQITTQIIEAIHHSALLPYTWDSLRIPKDIISPAQTVLLRLINHMFQATKNKNPPTDAADMERNIKLVYFLFASFRSRIVPECVALMHLQGQIRMSEYDMGDFPVDNWDMERAKDGLSQFLDFLKTVADMPEIRRYLIDWEVSYELLTLLKALEMAVEKKQLVELPKRSDNRPNQTPPHDAATADNQDWDPYDGNTPHPGPPPMQDAWQFPWAGIKIQILVILASLLQPPTGRSGPGNPEVQRQIVVHDGIVALLNCCVYDGHNPYSKERVQICLKWLMDGSKEANDQIRTLVAVQSQGQQAQLAQGQMQGQHYDPHAEAQARQGKVQGQMPGQQYNPLAEAQAHHRQAMSQIHGHAQPRQAHAPSYPPNHLPPLELTEEQYKMGSNAPRDPKMPSVADMLKDVSPEFSFKLNDAMHHFRVDGIKGEVRVEVRHPTTTNSTNPNSNQTSFNNKPSSSSTTTSHSNNSGGGPSANPHQTQQQQQQQQPPPLPPLPSANNMANINLNTPNNPNSPINLSNLLAAGFGSTGMSGAALNAGIAKLAAAGLLSGNDQQEGQQAHMMLDQSSILAPLQSHAAQLSAAADNLRVRPGPAGNAATRSRHEELLRDIVALADEAARLALGHGIGDAQMQGQGQGQQPGGQQQQGQQGQQRGTGQQGQQQPQQQQQQKLHQAQQTLQQAHKALQQADQLQQEGYQLQQEANQLQQQAHQATQRTHQLQQLQQQAHQAQQAQFQFHSPYHGQVTQQGEGDETEDEDFM